MSDLLLQKMIDCIKDFEPSDRCREWLAQKMFEEEQQIQFYTDSGGRCPVCYYDEVDYISTHERDSTCNSKECPKCKWSVREFTLEDVKDNHGEVISESDDDEFYLKLRLM